MGEGRGTGHGGRAAAEEQGAQPPAAGRNGARAGGPGADRAGRPDAGPASGPYAGPAGEAGAGRDAEPDADELRRDAEPDAVELRPDGVTRIMLRPLGSSLPLGFFAFGTASVLLTALELHWVPEQQTRQVMLLVLVFVVPLELVAAVFAFLARDAGAASAMGVFAGVWAGGALTMAMGSPGETSPVLALFLLTVAPVMLALFCASLPGKPAFGALLLLGACRFVLVGAYEAGAPNAVQTVAGWFGVALGAFALYGGLALLLEDGAQRTVLPVGRRGRARLSLEGDLGHQIHRTEREAGVRRQL
jgi:succinate-acetate transporter protein